MQKNLFYNIAVYGASNAIVALSPLVLLPLLTNALSVYEYGVYSNFLLMVGLVSVLIVAGAGGSISVNYHKLELSNFKKLLASSFYFVIANTFIVTSLLLLVQQFIFNSLNLDLYMVLLIIVTSLLNSITLILLSYFQTSNRPLKYLFVKLTHTAIDVGLTFILIIMLKGGLWERFNALSVSYLMAFVLGIIFLSRIISCSLVCHTKMLSKLAKFGYPLLPHALAGASIMYANRVSLSSIEGVESTGLYMVALQISMIIMLIIEPINKAFAPWLFSQLKNATIQIKSQIILFTYGFYAALIVVCYFLYLANNLIFDLLVDEAFHSAKNITTLLSIGFLFQGMYYSVTNYIVFTEKTYLLSLATVSSTVIGIMVSIVLITKYGVIGAAFGFVLTNFLLFMFAFICSNFLYPMPWLNFIKGLHA